MDDNLQGLINLQVLDKFSQGQKCYVFDTEITRLPYFKLLKMKYHQNYFNNTKEHGFPMFLLNTWAVLTETFKNTFRQKISRQNLIQIKHNLAKFYLNSTSVFPEYLDVWWLENMDYCLPHCSNEEYAAFGICHFFLFFPVLLVKSSEEKICCHQQETCRTSYCILRP